MASATQSPSSSRSSVALTAGAVLGCFLIFAAIVSFAYLKNRDTSLVPDLSKVEAADQWKYTEKGRTDRLTELRGKELSTATSYGWVDKSAGVVRLPIDRAMELIVAEQGAKR